jgi:hypothetical protein
VRWLAEIVQWNGPSGCSRLLQQGHKTTGPHQHEGGNGALNAAYSFDAVPVKPA